MKKIDRDSGGWRSDNEREVSAPGMSRSRNQLASAYAPGAFFTFEGGLGACISVPDQSPNIEAAQVSEQTKEQIVIRLKEIWQSWFNRAEEAGTPNKPVNPKLCIDEMLLGKSGQVEPLDRSSLEFVNPVRMGYAPAPLTFVCNTCGLFREFDSAAHAEKSLASFQQGHCQNPKEKGHCSWRQLDVIFVHWSGNWEPATPGMWEWSERNEKPYKRFDSCSQCNSRDFVLITSSPRIGEWVFKCARCGQQERASWLQNDRATTEIMRDQAGRMAPALRRMEPISYRASSAYYPQSEQFVVFSEEDQGLLALLAEERSADLESFIAKQFGLGETRPDIDEIRNILLQSGHTSEWSSYEQLLTLKELTKNDPTVQSLVDTQLAQKVDGWFRSGLVKTKNELPPALQQQIAARSLHSSRYDPFVLAVEHEALSRSKLNKTMPDGARRPFVRFAALDKHLAPMNQKAKEAQERESERLMVKLGFEEMGLVREFELCKFTHGYTRVSPIPVIEKHNQMMPVRLRMFEMLRNSKRPIYVVNQANEAMYVRLSPAAVYEWLNAVGVTDSFDWSPSSGTRLGAHILERAEPFGRFFSGLSRAPAQTYRYVYSLLHTYSHVLMKAIAEHSGLDLGSMGEYLFPADLAFVVYRNGTTMDLGNLSSLWRNENNMFLGHLLLQKTLLCNSGSLCDARGGACPDCIMVPETSCIAQNRLLSRAVLRGGVAPREDLTHEKQRIPGFLEIVNGTALKGGN
jgi:hypothetical protein